MVEPEPEPEPEPEDVRTATLRRIGRNLINVQRIELMLKFLLQVSYMGPLRELEFQYKRHLEKVSRKTMGALITDLAETVFPTGDAAPYPQDTKEVWIVSTVNIPLDEDARAAWKQEWETLRTERNKLVHLMLAKVDFNLPDQCRMLDLELDAQNVLFLKGIAFLSPVVSATQDAIAEMASKSIGLPAR